MIKKAEQKGNKPLLKSIILIIELLGLIVLTFVMIMRLKENNTTAIQLDNLSTEIDAMEYDGTAWHIDLEDGYEAVDAEYLLYGPGISLKRGTYTIAIDYSGTEINKGVVEVKKGIIDTADFFLLSNNKHHVSYDFTLKTDVEGFSFRLKKFYGGEFTLNNLTIIRNTHDIRTSIFIWVVLSLLIDAYLYLDIVRSNIRTIGIICGIALVASLPLFAQGIMTGDDIRFHFLRIEAIVAGLKSGDFPVKMYPLYNDGYGYPIAVFYGDVLLYFPALLRIIGFTTLQSYKAYIVFINVLTATLSYACGKRIFKSNITGFVFSMAFTLSTYRLLCLYARASVGEYSATCFYPLVILAIWNIYTQDINDKAYKKNSIILAIGMVGIIYNHVLSTEMIVLTIFILAMVFFKKTFRKETILVYIKAIALCLCISAAFIIPFVEYYTQLPLMLKSSFTSDYIQDSGVYISEYFAFFKSITGGDYVNRRGLLTPGLVLMAGLLVGLYLIIIKKDSKEIRVLTAGSLVSLFVASTICPWNRIYEIPVIGPILVTVQFPYRYIGISICFLCVLLGLVLEKIIEQGLLDKRIYYYTVITSLVMSCFFSSQYHDERYITSIFNSRDTADLYVLSRNGEFGMYMFTSGLYLLEDTNVSKEALDYGVYGENIQAAIIDENGVDIDIYVKAKDNATLEIPRFAYPHYVAKDNKGNILKTIVGHNNKVTVLFKKAYKGEVYIDFVEPWYWRLAEMISLIAVVGLLIIVINQKIIHLKERK